MNIKTFRQSKRWVDDIGAVIGMDLGEVVPGFVYPGGLTIETNPDAVDDAWIIYCTIKNIAK